MKKILPELASAVALLWVLLLLGLVLMGLAR